MPQYSWNTAKVGAKHQSINQPTKCWIKTNVFENIVYKYGDKCFILKIMIQVYWGML
jgi:hypothetical protein